MIREQRLYRNWYVRKTGLVVGDLVAIILVSCFGALGLAFCIYYLFSDVSGY